MKKNIRCLVLTMVFFVAGGFSSAGGGTLPLRFMGGWVKLATQCLLQNF